MMFDYNSRNLDHVGYIINQDDTIYQGLTGSYDCLMQSYNLETCYEGIAYHYSIMAQQFSSIKWPEGEDNDKIGRGSLLLKNYNVFVNAVWDNEDSRLIRVEEVWIPGGSHYICSGEKIDQKTWSIIQQKLESDEELPHSYPSFDWMVEESYSWLEMTPVQLKYLFEDRDKWVIGWSSGENAKVYSNLLGGAKEKDIIIELFIYADREKSDHHLLNSLGIVKMIYTEATKDKPFLFSKIYMSNAFNEGIVVIPQVEHPLNEPGESDFLGNSDVGNTGIILNGGQCKYTEDSLNFVFKGRIENDRLVKGKTIGLSFDYEGDFDDDTLITGDINYQFVDNWHFKGKIVKKAISGKGELKHFDNEGKLLEKIEGNWNYGVHESKKYMIIYGDAGERTLRLVLVTLREVDPSFDPNKKYEALSVFKFKDVVIRSCQFQGKLFKGNIQVYCQVMTDIQGKMYYMKRFQLKQIDEAVLEMRIFLRQLIFSEQLQTNRYYGDKYLKQKIYNTNYCYWKCDGEFSIEYSTIRKAYIAFYTYLKAELDFYPKKKAKLKSVTKFEIGWQMKKLLLDYYGEKKGSEFIKNLEDYSSGKDQSKIEFTYNNNYYWNEVFVIYLDKDTSKLLNKNILKEFSIIPDPRTYQREGIIFGSYGEVSIGTVHHHILHGGKGMKLFYKDAHGSIGKRVPGIGTSSFSPENEISDAIFKAPLIDAFTKSIKGEKFFGNYIRDSEGEIHYSNGAHYQGEIVLGHRHGKGVITFKNGESYNGEWFGGNKHGYGIYKWPCGDEAEGVWITDRLQTRGVMRLSTGDTYQGFWNNSELCPGQFTKIVTLNQ